MKFHTASRSLRCQTSIASIQVDASVGASLATKYVHMCEIDDIDLINSMLPPMFSMARKTVSLGPPGASFAKQLKY